MSTIRVSKTDKFAQIPNATLLDRRISLDAKGLLCHMLAKPTDWTWHKSQVMKETGCGRDRFERIWKELINVGYVQVSTYLENGLKRYDFTLYDLPPTENPYVADPHVVEPHVDSDTTTNTDLTKTDLNKTKKKESPSEVVELVQRMQSFRFEMMGDKFPETRKQLDLMAVLVRQHGEPTVRKVMEWAMANSFWSVVIITPTMLHKHFGRLKAESSRSVSTKDVFQQYLENHPEEDDQ